MQISARQTRSTSPTTHWAAAEDCSCHDIHPSDPVDVFTPVCSTTEADEQMRTALGQTLWDRYLDGRLELLPVQVSGRNDGADARSNIADTALGRQAKRSSYETAPGGRVSLSFSLLEGMVELGNDFDFRVTALAGGSHSSRSRHYLGVALDVDKNRRGGRGYQPSSVPRIHGESSCYGCYRSSRSGSARARSSYPHRLAEECHGIEKPRFGYPKVALRVG